MAIDRICTQCATLHVSSGELIHPLCDACVRAMLDQLEPLGDTD